MMVFYFTGALSYAYLPRHKARTCLQVLVVPLGGSRVNPITAGSKAR
jgi:hypothetical protein